MRQAATSTAVIDAEALERVSELGGSKLLHQLIDLFVEEGSRLVNTLRNATHLSQLPDAQRVAHSLKSTAGHLGAIRLSQLAEEMEQAAISGDHDRVRPLRAALCTEFDRAAAELAHVREGLSRVP